MLNFKFYLSLFLNELLKNIHYSDIYSSHKQKVFTEYLSMPARENLRRWSRRGEVCRIELVGHKIACLMVNWVLVEVCVEVRLCIIGVGQSYILTRSKYEDKGYNFQGSQII